MYDTLEIIKGILESHKGENNAISAGIIGNILELTQDDTHAKARKLIRECIQKYQLPVLSSSNGYFIVNTDYEFNKYIANLDSRIAGIEQRKTFVTEYYQRSKQNEANN